MASTIVVQHRITDPEGFLGRGEEVVGNAPSGVRALQFCPSQDHGTAVCLWEAESIDALRDYLDPVSEGFAENTYYAVDEEHAFGVPDQAAARA
jgi:hypothetical protein